MKSQESLQTCSIVSGKFPMVVASFKICMGFLKHILFCARTPSRWPLDYFMKSHVSASELYVQVGDQSENAYVRSDSASLMFPLCLIMC